MTPGHYPSITVARLRRSRRIFVTDFGRCATRTAIRRARRFPYRFRAKCGGSPAVEQRRKSIVGGPGHAPDPNSVYSVFAATGSGPSNALGDPAVMPVGVCRRALTTKFG